MKQILQHDNNFVAMAPSSDDPPRPEEPSSETTPPPPPTFVDYSVKAPGATILPPAKYKLWILIWCLVYLARWVSDGAQLLRALQFGGWVSPHAAQFLLLYLIVFVLVYAGLDFAVTVGTFRCGTRTRRWCAGRTPDDDGDDGDDARRECGLGPWLKAPRAAWMYRNDRYRTSLLVQLLATAVWTLERGFCMFDAAPDKKTSAARTAAVVRVKRKGTTALLSSSSAATSFHSDDDSDGDSDDSDDDGDRVVEYFPRCESATCHTVLKIEHRIDPGKLSDYDRWLSKIREACRQQRGLLQVESAGITAEEDEEDAQQRSHDSGNMIIIDAEKQQQQQRTPRKNDDSSRMLHVVYCTFENIEYLNEWLLSPRRQVLMTELRPMLVQPDSVQIQRDRILPDAFTDLVAAQGQSVPKRAPKKWKVWWLTTVALYATIRWTDSFLEFYYEAWGLDGAHPRVRALVGVTVSTFLNSYVLTPLLLFLFHPWMQRESARGGEDDEVERQEPWRTLNDGIRDNWIKALITLAFYGGCVIAWIVRDYVL